MNSPTDSTRRFGSASIACIASREPIARARFLDGEDLAPLPAGSLDEVVASFRELDGRYLSEARLLVSVVR